MSAHAITSQDRFEIRPPFLFRWEDSQQAHVLLYPEGIVKLNESGGGILQLCDGKHTVGQIIEQLCKRYCAADETTISKGVLNFLEVSHGKGWIRTTA